MDLAAWTPRALSVLRIVTGLLFLEHGTGKLLGFPPSDHAAPTLFSLIGVQGVLETCAAYQGSATINGGMENAIRGKATKSISGRSCRSPFRPRRRGRGLEGAHVF